MSLWRQLTRGLRVLTHRTNADQDVTEEAGHYLEESTAAFIAQGMSPDEARRAARMELGNMATVTEQVRTHGWENRISTLFADLRYGFRSVP